MAWSAPVIVDSLSSPAAAASAVTPVASCEQFFTAVLQVRGGCFNLGDRPIRCVIITAPGDTSACNVPPGPPTLEDAGLFVKVVLPAGCMFSTDAGQLGGVYGTVTFIPAGCCFTAAQNPCTPTAFPFGCYQAGGDFGFLPKQGTCSNDLGTDILTEAQVRYCCGV